MLLDLEQVNVNVFIEYWFTTGVPQQIEIIG